METSRRVFLTEDASSVGLAKPKAGDLPGTVQTPSVSPGDEGYLSDADDDTLFDALGQFILLLLNLICEIFFSSKLPMTR